MGTHSVVRTSATGRHASGAAFSALRPTGWRGAIAGAVLAGVGALQPVLAQSEVPATSPWRVSGFATLGVVQRTGGADWGFERNNNQTGTVSDLSLTPDTRAGIQVNWTPDTRWEAALQAVRMSSPPGMPPAESIQYAYLGYQTGDDTRIRIGRNAPDLFLFTDSRNVGYALPWARPPADFYGFVPFTAFDGIDLQQRWTSGDALWRARATLGQFHSSPSGIDGQRLPISGSRAFALGLTREDDGLTLKLSALRARADVDFGPQTETLRQALAGVAAIPVPGVAERVEPLQRNLWTHGDASYLGIAMQYENGPWTLIAEGSRLWIPDSLAGSRRGYVSLGWRHRAVTYYALASRVLPTAGIQETPDLATSLTPVLGSDAARAAQTVAGYGALAVNTYRSDQGTLALGLRWDFHANAALKVQLDHVDVRRWGGQLWRRYDGSASTVTLLSVLVDVVVGP